MGNCIVIHLTQGSTLSGAKRTLEANRSWSNTLYDPRTDEEHVFTESEKGDRSLRNLAGGVETNNRPGVWQIEIVGYSERVRGYGDEWYTNLAKYLRRRCDTWNVPYVFPYPFFDSDKAYGTRAKSRLSANQWLAAEGIVGHQHVPENTHWDPGPIDVAKLLKFGNQAKEAEPLKPHPEAGNVGPLLALYLEEVELIAEELRGTRLTEQERDDWRKDLFRRIYVDGEQILAGSMRWWAWKLSGG